MPHLTFQNLLKIAAKLRSPDGCPWDRQQTIASLQKDFAEEAQEMNSAIAKKDYQNLQEEIGDVLFNLILMVQIAEEEKLFTIKEVLQDIEKKIIERHTWVFGDDKGKVKTAEDAIKLWKKNKLQQKNQKSGPIKNGWKAQRLKGYLFEEINHITF